MSQVNSDQDQGADALVGQAIADYRLDALVGTGLTGAVYLAHRIVVPGKAATRGGTDTAADDLPEVAAVKVLMPPWQASPAERDDFRERFLREAQTLETLRHPHIVPVLRHGRDDKSGLLYMIMPYMAGGTLENVLAQASAGLPPHAVASILAQLADALDYAHAAGVIHRDVKPANVLLDAQGEVALSDFSVARHVQDARATQTTAGKVLGTFRYMSPEQARGERVSAAADQYSLAVLAYQLITGRVPFDADSFVTLALQHIQQEVAPPRMLRPDLPDAAQAAILRALAKQPGARFPDAASFARAFAASLSSGSGGASPPSRVTMPIPVVPEYVPPAIERAPAAEVREERRLALIGGMLLTLLVLVGLAALLAKGALPPLMGQTHGTPTAGNPTATFGGVGSGQTPTVWGGGQTATPGTRATKTPVTPPTNTPVTPPTNTPVTPATNTPIPHQVFREYNIPASGASADGIAAGPDGNLWFADPGTNAIGRITTSGSITEFPIPTSNSRPYQIVSGPDGNLWFSEANTNQVGRITTSGYVNEFPVPTSSAKILGITAGPDGNVWFTEGDALKIGRITPSGAITEFPYSGAGSAGIITGPDGNLWFTEIFGNQVVRMDTNGNVTTFTPPTSGSGPLGITSGPDGNLWLVEYYSNKIARLTTSGAFTEFPIPTASSYPARITPGPDGNLWFTETIGGKIGVITPGGAITEFTPPSGGNPSTITQGSDGNLWFTQGGTIGCFIP